MCGPAARSPSASTATSRPSTSTTTRRTEPAAGTENRTAAPDRVGFATARASPDVGPSAAATTPPLTAPVESVAVTHAVTDGPSVDVVLDGGALLANDLPYGQASSPTTLAPGAYRAEVRRSNDQAVLGVVRFTLDGTEGIFALATTGFLNPAANQNGPAFALTATDSTGTVDGGVIVTGAEDAPTAGLSLAVASPTRAGAAVRYAVPTDGPVRLVVVDVLGREVAVLADGERAAGAHTARLNGAHAPGADVVRLTTPGGASSRRVTDVR